MEKDSNITYQLKINDLRLWVHLGCSEEEKANPQQVGIDIVFDFIHTPLAIYSDELKDTICYKEIVDSISFLCNSKRFNLIECLSEEIFNCIKSCLSLHKQQANIGVSVRKISPPIPCVLGGVQFNCQESSASNIKQFNSERKEKLVQNT